MKTASEVDALVAKCAAAGDTKTQICIKAAEACMGWSYVWGAAGQYCTTSNRKSYANRSSCPDGEKKQIYNKCQVLSGKKSACTGCPYYPKGVTRFFDCRGFTRWIIQRVGVTIQGAGATSQYNTNANWTQKGLISGMPDVFCCVFMYSSKTGKMEHTGLHVGGGKIIHCSGTVKTDTTANKKWTHYAIPKGVDGEFGKPVLRRGDSGAFVTLLQTELIQKGYSCGSTGADGKFGKNTEAAVKTFQKKHGIPVTGVVNDETWIALDGAKPAIKYTVTVPGLTESQADALITQYPGSKKTEERG